MKKILVCGGNGTVAGTAFLLRLSTKIAKYKNSTNDHNFPSILFSNFSFKMNHTGYPLDIENDTISFNELCKQDFDIATFACNTAHSFFEFDNRFVSFVEASTKTSIDKKIICSRYSRDNKIFGERIYSDDNEQVIIDEIISDVAVGKIPYNKIHNIVEKNNGELVLACTELSYSFYRYEEINKSYGMFPTYFESTDDVVINEIIKKIM